MNLKVRLKNPVFILQIVSSLRNTIAKIALSVLSSMLV